MEDTPKETPGYTICCMMVVTSMGLWGRTQKGEIRVHMMPGIWGKLKTNSIKFNTLWEHEHE